MVAGSARTHVAATKFGFRPRLIYISSMSDGQLVCGNCGEVGTMPTAESDAMRWDKGECDHEKNRRVMVTRMIMNTARKTEYISGEIETECGVADRWMRTARELPEPKSQKSDKSY